MFHFYQLKEVLKVFTELVIKFKLHAWKNICLTLPKILFFFFFFFLQEFQTRSFCDTEKVIESFIYNAMLKPDWIAK